MEQRTMKEGADAGACPAPRRRKRIGIGALGLAVASLAVTAAVVAVPQPAPQDALAGAAGTVKAALAEQAEQAEQVEQAGEPAANAEAAAATVAEIDGYKVKTDSDGTRYVADVALVRLEDGCDAVAVSEQIAATGLAADASISAEEAESGLAEIELSEGVDEAEASERFADVEGVKISQLNYVYESDSASSASPTRTYGLAAAGNADLGGKTDAFNPIGTSDTIEYKAAKTYLDKLGIPDRSVTVAVIDSYIYTRHYDLAANIVGTYDVVNGRYGTPDPTASRCSMEGNGHGTAVAGVIGAVAGNKWGPDGLGANKVGIYGVGTGSSGVSDTRKLWYGYQHVMNVCETYNIRVVNLSCGFIRPGSRKKLGSNGDAALMEQITAAGKKGILTVCAAGNDGKATSEVVPGDFARDTGYGITVMGLGKSLAKGASWSNYNPSGHCYKELSAPGYFLQLLSWSGKSRGSTADGHGTSLSAPAVSAAAACMFAVNPDLTPGQVRNLLKNNATKLCGAGYNWGTRTGYGCVNMLKSVKAARSSAKLTVGAVAYQKYTGRAITPNPTVKFGKKTLRKGIDYTLSYKNNKNTGAAMVTATGKGAYAGLKGTRTFYIYYNAPVYAC